ncbi:MAG: 6-bladed beta-propeller [Roseivirga sp.]
MSKIHLLSSSVLLITLLAACGTSESKTSLKVKNEPPFLIEVEKARDVREAVFLSDFASKIEYIQPEVSKQSLIGRNAHFYITADHLVSTARRQILLFDRESGSFLKEVGKYGQGPDEYRSTYPYLHFNETSKATYVQNNSRKILGLDASGNTVTAFQLPMDDNTLVSSFVQLAPDLFAGYHSNYDCNQDIKLVIFNENGEVIKTYKNQLTCVNHEPGSIFFDLSEGTFYNWNKQAFFKESYNDTLFHVSREALQTWAIFDCGESSLPYEDKTKDLQSDPSQTYFSISDIDETKDFIFFNMTFRGETHSAYYDKVRDITKVTDPMDSENHRFLNDVDGFLPFRASYATEDGKLVGYMEAPEVAQWFEDNPEKAAKLPANLKRLESTSDDDNPIVMIVSLKD